MPLSNDGWMTSRKRGRAHRSEWIWAAMPGITVAGITCPHASVRKPRDPVRVPIDPVRDPVQDVCHKRRIDAARSAPGSFFRDHESGERASLKPPCDPIRNRFAAGTVEQWRAAGFGHPEYTHTMRWVVPSVTLAAVGFRTLLSGFFASILGMHKRN